MKQHGLASVISLETIGRVYSRVHNTERIYNDGFDEEVIVYVIVLKFQEGMYNDRQIHVLEEEIELQCDTLTRAILMHDAVAIQFVDRDEAFDWIEQHPEGVGDYADMRKVNQWPFRAFLFKNGEMIASNSNFGG